VAYDDACRLAHAGEVDAAVKALERAAGLERNRKGALVDPWFADLRAARSADVHAVLRYWEIVGPPAEAFTDLPPFGTHASALRALGVTGARDLLVVTADRGEALAASLEIPKTVTAAWWAFARLAEPRGRRARWLDARELRLLWEIGVRSDDDLTTAMQQPGLSTRLVEAAERLVVRPPTDSESALILLPRPDAGKGADSRRTRVAGQPRRRSPVSR
jgi:hypothetical protein